MSEFLRIALAGATGLIGKTIIDLSIGRDDFRLVGLARREVSLPRGVRMEMFVADPARWNEVFEAVRPQALICALGTTWRKSGEDEAAFRAVDHELVLETARAARDNGIERMVAISSAGASLASRTFYLRVKAEMERDLAKVGFKRLDILRPGLLRGPRSNDRRPGERIGIAVSPLTDLFLRGGMRRFRSIPARTVAEAALGLTMRKAAGRFIHDNDGIRRAAREFPQPVGV
ncbi:NAD(P)H-binding protein [Pelagerythrobacter rhizovicinus]|uniref:NAD-dependent epimerase/dehydratase family protein n=1 Tax=Pelagerythrobacter rhizovicinus TaxID=2268576 RepID=A0A4Q2KP44_9SPHN|nr:NAD(P)H-binding protein [Pelagerythrobacter rhizovicinus]RXZ66359.1 NAD-dependent epimerase/dehydratase family protein [Pelagerythrobacter rhizovicinus]